MEQTQVFMPSVDIVEGENAFEIHADMPGISSDKINENLSVELENGVLFIKGKVDFVNQKLTNSRNEFLNGEYRRSFKFDEKVVSAEIKAHYSNGVLKLILPKRKDLKNKISIQVA